MPTGAVMMFPYDFRLVVFGVAIATFMLLMLALRTSFVARHLQVEAASAEALRQSEARFRSLVQNSSDLITILELDGTIRYASPSLERILGYQPEDLIDKNAFDYIHPEDATKVAPISTDMMQNPTATFPIEYRFRHANGTWIHLESLASNQLDNPNIKGIVVNSRNITKRKQAESALWQMEQKYRSIFENAVEGIFQTTPDGQYLTVNPMLARIYGYNSPLELIATVTDIKHQLYVNPNSRIQFQYLLQKQDAVWGFESQVYRKDGSAIWISENARAIRDERGNLLGYEGTVVDITQRKQAEAELHRRERLLQGVAAAMNHLLTNTDYSTAITKALNALGTATDVDRVYIYEQHSHPETGETTVNLRFEWQHQSASLFRNQRHLADDALGLASWYQTLTTKRVIGGSLGQFPDAEREILEQYGIVSLLIIPIFIDQNLWGYIGFENHQTERLWSQGEESLLMAMAASIGGTLQRQSTEAMIRYQALHDLLTGLPNRTLLNQRLNQALDAARQYGYKMAVMFLDLDRFKNINDTLGHAIGDQLLTTATQRLKSCLRTEDTLARWGGDEFTLVLPQIRDSEDTTKIAQRILDVLKPAFNLEGHQLYITSSIGIAVYPQDGEDAQTLLRNADAALYCAKSEGRNNYQFYAPAINFQASELLVLENHLHQALEKGEFLVYYQPQVNINTGQIKRMEALVRWQHPQLGLVSPKTFIPLAEETGLIVPLGNWILQTACAQLKAWQDAGLSDLRVAVNLSPRQFQQPNLVASVVQVLEKTGLDPQLLELEITETTAMQNVDFSREIIKSLAQMGVHITLDDFGTGYSSLNYLKTFPFHTLKIDQTFVQDLTSDARDAAIVKALIALGYGLDLQVVAEGVETVEQLEYLRSLECEEMQGYLFSRPLPVEAATAFLLKNCRFQMGFPAKVEGLILKPQMTTDGHR